MTIAQTILDQLGGQRFRVMTGARDFVNTGKGLQFRLPRIASNGIRYVRVELTPADLYTVTFINARLQTVLTREGVYADKLREVFTDATGLDTSL
jgi:hypothetical protein